MLDVIRKKPKIQATAAQNSVVPRESGIAAAGPAQGLSGMNTGMGVGGMGYNAGQTGNAGTMMGMQ